MSKLRPTVAAAGLICALSTSAHAYERLTRTGCADGIAWASDPTFYFNADGVPATEEADYRHATEVIMERVNFVGGTWFDFRALGTLLTSEDMVENGYNEVGMTELDHSDDSWTLGWGPSWVNTRTCKIVEADMHLTNWDGISWAFGVPADEGVNYWEANDSVGMTYFARPIILHELGHTFGLAHSDTSYSYMNYNVLPWSNRADDKRVEPLADDRKALREIYPGTAEESDIAVYTTWYDPENTSNGAARAFSLCAPSKGTSWSSSIFDSTCGVAVDGGDGATEVCPGDTLRVRYVVSNLGTNTLEVEAQLWLSENTTLNRDVEVDKQSPSVRSFTAAPQSSYRRGNTFEVPTGVTFDTDYHVYVFLDTGADYADEESQQNNAIPMVGQIRIKPYLDCVELARADVPALLP